MLSNINNIKLLINYITINWRNSIIFSDELSFFLIINGDIIKLLPEHVTFVITYYVYIRYVVYKYV